MEISEIKEKFWEGTQKYLQYLADNGLGVERIAVKSITPIDKDECVYMLKTEKKVFDDCGLEFSVNGKILSASACHVVQNNKKLKLLTIQAHEKFKDEFETLEKDNIFVIADLKFLVSRVANWYEKFGGNISIPENKPSIPEPQSYGVSTEPSDCQKKAIKTIFSQPMSYIWGAPGTGKTGFVLANCILNYLKYQNSGIILLAAPTNAALEQTLFRLLPILSQNNIDLKGVVRLGNPSARFMQEYPDLCEDPKLAYEVDSAAEELQTLVRYEQAMKKIQTLKDEKYTSELKKSCELLKKIYPHFDYDNPDEAIKNAKKKLEKLKKKTFSARVENELSVVACTVDAYIGRHLNTVLPKTARGLAHIFLDEACYCCLAKALTFFSCKCPITFLGDHMQLPPVCEMPDDELCASDKHEAVIWAQSAIYAENVFYEDIEQMYEEYMRNIPPNFDYMQKADLNYTHRFGSGLTEVLERHVYQNHFMSAVFSETEIICVDTAGNYAAQNRENTAEVKAVKAYVDKYKPSDYVILTPYRNQAKKLSEKLGTNVMTVHKSQGQEWDTVILSVTDTKNKYFTDSLNPVSKGLQLLNTAVSRAKNTLVIVCDAQYWKNLEGQLIKDLIGISQIKKVSELNVCTNLRGGPARPPNNGNPNIP